MGFLLCLARLATRRYAEVSTRGRRLLFEEPEGRRSYQRHRKPRPSKQSLPRFRRGMNGRGTTRSVAALCYFTPAMASGLSRQYPDWPSKAVSRVPTAGVGGRL